MTGRFITIEGGEGAGKSTAQAYLAERLAERGIAVLQTREPGGTPLAEAIRQTLLSTDGEHPVEMAELLLVFAARAQHLAKVIEPALAAGQWVICDRFTDATYAYQGAARGLSADLIAQLETLVQGERRPDAVVVMDLSPEVGMTRAKQRGELDRFEREEPAFYSQVRNAYLDRAQADPDRYRVTDAEQSLESVRQALSKLVEGWLCVGTPRCLHQSTFATPLHGWKLRCGAGQRAVPDSPAGTLFCCSAKTTWKPLCWGSCCQKLSCVRHLTRSPRVVNVTVAER